MKFEDVTTRVNQPDPQERARPSLSGVPQLPGWFVSRPRLLEALDRAATHPLVVLRGSGGSGKSTLAADWLRHGAGSEPVVWLSLDEGAGSPLAFWRRVEVALARSGVAIAPGEPSSGESPRARMVELLAAAGPVRLAIDDFHHTAPELAEDVAWVLERSPGLRILVTTRRRETFEDVVTRSRIDVAVLATAQLAFTRAESAELASRTLGAPESVAAALHSATHGNPLALRLAITALESGRGDGDPSEVAEHVATQAARHFLPVFARPDDRDAAIRLAVSPYVEEAVAVELTGRDDVGALLVALERGGIGSVRVERGNRRFRFHPLVAHSLAERIPELGAHETRRLRRIAATFLEGAGDPVAAAEQLLAAEDFEAVGPLVMRNFSELWNHFAVDLETAILRVPLDTIRRHPTLALVLAVMRAHHETLPTTLTRSLAEEALPALRRRVADTPPAERFVPLAIMLVGYRAVHRYVEAAATADALLTMTDELLLPPAGGDLATVDVVLVVAGGASILGGRLSTALAAAQRVSLEANPWRAIHALSLGAFVAAMRGEVEEATRLTRLIAERDRLHGRRGNLGALGWHIAEALTALDRFDAAHALDALDGLDVDRGLVDLWPFPVWVRAFARLVADDPRTGSRELLDSLNRAGRHPASDFARDLLTGMAADVALAAGEAPRARLLLARVPDGPATTLARARLALADDDPGLAVGLVEGGRADDRWSSRQKAEALLLSAVASHRLGLDAAARADAAQALSAIDRTGAAATLALVPTRDLVEILGHDAAAVALLEASPDPFGDAMSVTRLTPRERDVLTALASVEGVAAISDLLYVSVNTVKTQLRGLYRKLGVSTRAEAVQVARRRGLLDD